MKKRIALIGLAALLVAASVSALAPAAMVGIYRNGMESLTQRSQLIKLSGRSCARAGTESALRITVGKQTEACTMRTPVLGSDLEIAATERLLSGTPAAVARKAFLGVELRAGQGAKYQLLVYPMQKKAQLIKVTPDGPEFYDIAKNLKTVMGLNGANTLRLQTLKLRSGPEAGSVAVKGFLGRELIVSGTDALPGDLPGKASTVTVGAPKNGSGVVASIDDIVVRVPSPY
jgi:hypothetical protein